MKKLIIYTAIGAILIVSGVFVTQEVYAQELGVNGDTFVSRLAAKLGINESDVNTAMDEVRTEVQAEREAERAETITQALDDGKLTEKQAEILNALEDINVNRGRPEDWEEWKEYTPEQKEALQEARHELIQQDRIDALYEQGIEVTQEEMDNLHDVMEELGIGMYGARSNGGQRGGMGQGMMLHVSEN
jgi:hypothetical protein